MKRYAISHDPEPIRLFKSDFLEFFTHITPAVVLAIWLPVCGYFLGRAYRAVRLEPGFPWHIPGGFLLGLFLWTFTEYTLHRFVFHFRPRNAFQERIIFLFHGVHHAQPQCKTRLLMPPAVSVPLAFLFYFLFKLAVEGLLGMPLLLHPLMSGFVAGYLVYDMTHYATHHFPMRSGIWKFLKRYHMQHHYKTPDRRFGVSSPFWDYIFRTYPLD